METLYVKRSNYRFIAVDFDILLNVCIEGVNVFFVVI